MRLAAHSAGCVDMHVSRASCASANGKTYEFCYHLCVSYRDGTHVRKTHYRQLIRIFTLKVGPTTQTVQVTGEAPAVQLANSSISGVVNQTAVVELPLNGRDWISLATLQTRVTSVGSVQAVPSANDRGVRGCGGQMAISGSRPTQNNYRIDSISANDYANSGPGSVEGSSSGMVPFKNFPRNQFLPRRCI
jgi:hypothetical protein